jgi:hypothetical protein
MRITDEYFRYATHQIRIGRRARMPGVRTCIDCDALYRSDTSGIPWCPDCRPAHERVCTGCGVRFPGDRDGTQLCRSCRDQEPLF